MKCGLTCVSKIVRYVSIHMTRQIVIQYRFYLNISSEIIDHDVMYTMDTIVRSKDRRRLNLKKKMEELKRNELKYIE